MGFIETSYGGNVTLSNVDIDSDLNLKNEYDLIGVKRFVCQDYLGAVIGSASDNIQKTISIDITGDQYSDKIRIPSNFVTGSTFRVILTASESTTKTRWIYPVNNPCFWVSDNTEAWLYNTAYVYVVKYDPVTDTYTRLKNIITEGTIISGNKRYVDISGINAGDYICIETESVSAKTQTLNRTYFYYISGGSHITPASNLTATAPAVSSSVNTNDFSIACDFTIYADPNVLWDD